MADTILKGTTDPLLQHESIDWDPSCGYTREQEWKGLSYAEMEAKTNLYNYYGINTKINYDKGVATLTTHDATGNVLIDQWELVVTKEQPDVYDSPQIRKLLNDYSEEDIDSIMQALSLYSDPTQTWATAIASYGSVDPEAGAIFKSFFNLKRMNHTNYMRSKYILRHTTNAPNRWQGNVANDNCERLYSQAAFLSEVQSTSLWVFPMPGYLASAIVSYLTEVQASFPNTDKFGGFSWSWYKERSGAGTQANNRVGIVTEYMLDQWSLKLYGDLI